MPRIADEWANERPGPPIFWKNPRSGELQRIGKAQPIHRVFKIASGTAGGRGHGKTMRNAMKRPRADVRMGHELLFVRYREVAAYTSGSKERYVGTQSAGLHAGPARYASGS